MGNHLLAGRKHVQIHKSSWVSLHTCISIRERVPSICRMGSASRLFCARVSVFGECERQIHKHAQYCLFTPIEITAAHTRLDFACVFYLLLSTCVCIECGSRQNPYEFFASIEVTHKHSLVRSPAKSPLFV